MSLTACGGGASASATTAAPAAGGETKAGEAKAPEKDVKTTTLKLAFNQSEKHPQYLALSEMSDAFYEATGGAYRIEISPNELLGSQKDAFELVQEIFAKYRQWDRRLQYALASEHPLDEMLLASLGLFGNPMFIHDTDFYILSCPRYVQGMTVWERDSRTGRSMVPLSLIHDFKADTEYLDTLSKKSPDLFSAEQRGYRNTLCESLERKPL